MRVLIANVYSYKNKGDAAIVLALIQEIRRVFPSADIIAQTADKQHDEGKYGVPVTSSLLWLLFSSVRRQSLPKRLWTVIRGLGGLVPYLLLHKAAGRAPQVLLTKDLREFMRQNHAADMVIACGGGYLRTSNAGAQDTLLLLGTCLNFLAAKYARKPVYLYSQSIGPVHGPVQRAMLRFTLNRVDLIEPREDISVAFLKSLNLHTKVIATADPALLLSGQAKAPAHIRLDPARLPIGITVRKWFHNSQSLERYIQAIAQTIDYLVEQHHAQVFYIPQVIAEDFGDDDRLIAERVHAKVQHKQYFTVITDDLHPFEIIGLCGRMHAFVGTRMHSNIFSLITHTPVVAIEYEHKTRGIMRGLGMNDMVVDIQDATYSTLKTKIDQLLAEHDKYRQLIAKNLPGQIQKSQAAIEAIEADYREAI